MLEGRDGSPECIQQVRLQVSTLTSTAPSTRIVSTVLLNQQIYTGLKRSRSSCTTGERLGWRVRNGSHHHTWSSTSVCRGIQNSPPPSQGKHQHHWCRAPTSNLGCVKTPFWLILLSFLRNCLWDTLGHRGWFLGCGRSAALSPPSWESLRSKINTQLQNCFAGCQRCLQTSLPAMQSNTKCCVVPRKGWHLSDPPVTPRSVLLHLLPSQPTVIWACIFNTEIIFIPILPFNIHLTILASFLHSPSDAE